MTEWADWQTRADCGRDLGGRHDRRLDPTARNRVATERDEQVSDAQFTVIRDAYTATPVPGAQIHPRPRVEPVVCPECGGDVDELPRTINRVYFVDLSCSRCDWYDEDQEGGV